MKLAKQLRAYSFPIILLTAILMGGWVGHYFPHAAARLQPLGDIFLNLLFTAIVPLVFFSVAAAISQLGQVGRLWKILYSMLISFLFAGVIASIFMLIVVKLFPPAAGVMVKLQMPNQVATISVSDQIVKAFTVTDFTQLFSHQKMLALIVFSMLVGLATAAVGAKGKSFALFLQAGADVFSIFFSFIMYYAPIGFFAYFAVLVNELGPALLQSYMRIMCIYYIAGMVYLVFGFTFFAHLADQRSGIRLFWKNAPLPMLTALATCSSAATIPANLQATKNIGVPADIAETVVPLGTILHKQGSILGGIVKIAFLFGIFHMSFSGLPVLLMALMVSLLVGTVMGAIPSGGMLGELLILSLYGFPPQALMVIAAISLIIDPLATVINVSGNTVCSMLTNFLCSKSRASLP